MDPSHDELIRLAQLLAPELGYTGDVKELSGGICYGYASMVLELLLTGKMSTLQQQLITLKQLIDEQHILEPGHSIPEEYKPKLRKLFKKILIHHRPSAFLHIQAPDRKTYIQALVKTMPIVQSKALKAVGGLHLVATCYGVYNVEMMDLQNYLMALQETIASSTFNSNIPFVLSLCNGEHHILVGYNPRESIGPWFFCNIGAARLIYNVIDLQDIEALALYLNKGILTRPHHATKDYIIRTQVYCARNNSFEVAQFAEYFLLHLKKCQLIITGLNQKTDALGWTPLHMIATTGDINTLEDLKPSIHNINALTNKGITPLMFASESGMIEVVNSFIEIGADLNLCDQNRRSSLMIAAFYGHTDIVKLLIQKNSILDLQSDAGNSALMIAAQNGHTDIATLLIKNGANLNLWNRYGYSALIIAIKSNHHEIAVLLIESGAEIPLEIVDEELATLLAQYKERLLMSILNQFFSTKRAYFYNIDRFKEIFKEDFDTLLEKNALTTDEKKCLILLYIVLRDAEGREERRRIPAENTFFKFQYLLTKREFTAYFMPQCTYHEKRKAAIDLLEAIENGTECPQNPALYKDRLLKIVQLCFPDVASSNQSGYFPMSMSLSGRIA